MKSVTQTALFPSVALCLLPPLFALCLLLKCQTPPPSTPSWPPLFIHLSPSPPLCPSFCPSSLSSLCNLVLKNANSKQGWIDPDSRRIDGTLLQSGDHTERKKRREGWTFFFLQQLGRVWGWDDEERWRTREEWSWAYVALAVISSHAPSKLPTSWLDSTHWTFLPEAHMKRQDSNVMHCTANSLTMLPIFSPVTVLLQNYVH